MLNRVRLTAFDLFLYATVVVAWGFAWIGIHFQVGIVSPDVSIAWRFLLAGLVMIAIAALPYNIAYPLDANTGIFC